MATRKSPKPEPVSLNIVCSICDEPWNLHKQVNGEVSTLECVRLLKLKRVTWTPTITFPPYRPYVQPYWATTTIQCSTISAGNQTVAGTGLTTNTPTNIVNASAAA